MVRVCFSGWKKSGRIPFHFQWGQYSTGFCWQQNNNNEPRRVCSPRPLDYHPTTHGGAHRVEFSGDEDATVNGHKITMNKFRYFFAPQSRVCLLVWLLSVEGGHLLFLDEVANRSSNTVAPSPHHTTTTTNNHQPPFEGSIWSTAEPRVDGYNDRKAGQGFIVRIPTPTRHNHCGLPLRFDSEVVPPINSND